MAVYIGNTNSTKKQISSMYVGVNGNRREVATGYALKNGSVTKVYSNVAPPGQTVFTSSGTFVVPKGIKSVDIFLVGGGGYGTYKYNYTSNNHGYGAGGGGGYTTTAKGVSVTPGGSYPIVVGAGQNPGGSSMYGGTSSGLGYSATGGTGGNRRGGGGWGGSGGGEGDYRSDGNSTCVNGGNGGSDGSNGWARGNHAYYSNSSYPDHSKGQGTTTRAFGESSGTLYAGGGGGATYSSDGTSPGEGGAGGGGKGNGSSGTAGTGGGGGGTPYDSYSSGGWGGSGCVIIRWR